MIVLPQELAVGISLKLISVGQAQIPKDIGDYILDVPISYG